MFEFMCVSIAFCLAINKALITAEAAVRIATKKFGGGRG
jgi:hypothetical protein